MILSIINLALNIAIIIYLVFKKNSINRKEIDEFVVFRDKDGYLINSVRKNKKDKNESNN